MSKPLTWDSGLRWDTPGLTWDGSLPDSPVKPQKRTTSMTTTEVFGFADAVNQAMSTNQADLLIKGLTVAPWLTDGASLKTDAVTKNTTQEATKAALKGQTAAADGALQALYDFYSSKLDVMAGAYGKTTDQGKQLLRLRSDVRRGPNAPKPAATAAKP